MPCSGFTSLLVRSLRLSGRASQVHHRRLLLSLAVLLVPLLVSCRGSGPDVVLVPALPATRTQTRTAESFRVRVLIELEDGSVTISKNRVTFPAGAWITLVSEQEMDE